MASYFWISTASTDPTVGANWQKSDGTTGAVPGNGDDVTIAAVAGLALANIGAADMGSVTLNSLTVSQSFTGTIGTSDLTSPTFGYWQIGATTWTIGKASADGTAFGGAGRIKLDFGSAAFIGTVINTGASIDTGCEPLRIKGSSGSNSLFVLGGRVGVATTMPGESATLAEIDVVGSAAIANLGPGVTWAKANVSTGGTLTVNSGSSGTLNVASGSTAAINGSAAVATVNAGGAVACNHRPSSGAAIGALNLYPTGTADFSQNPAAVTVTTLNHEKGGVLTANPA
ncbi:MAG TPA: hypothetical protein VHY37_03390, partial [Tepidisphaeraceae bacterium]|nr:hypothetical protein [Tepidisphaeraceae bacterium]